MIDRDPRLVVLRGLPGVGKTTIARGLASTLPAFHVRIDSIETPILAAGNLGDEIEDLGYQIGYRVAADNLSLGLSVVADLTSTVRCCRLGRTS